jgi:glycosyltransferase involved in cell wall biosynthesis
MRLLRDPAVTALLVPGEEHRARALADVHLPRDRVIVLPPGIDGGSPQARAVDGSLVVGARVRRRIDLIILLRGLAIARRGLAISALVAPCGLPQALVAEMTASVGLPAEAVRTVGLGDEIVGSDVAIELDATDIALHHLVDALAAGRPVIAVSEGALPELVVDGRSGVLVPVRDAEALAAALRQLAAADRRSTLAAGAIQAARRFSVSLTGEVLLGVYRAAVGGASAGGATTWRRLSAERTTSPRTTSLDAAASPPSSAARGATQRHV